MSRMGWDRSDDIEEQERFEQESDLRGRLFFLRLLVVLVFGFLLSYIVYLQQTRGQDLALRSADNRTAELTTNAPRGVIVDRNGAPLAENLPSFDVSITPAFLPRDAQTRQAVFERLSLLTGVPVTNTLEQEQLLLQADARTIGITNRLATLYGAGSAEALGGAGVVPLLPESITRIVEKFSFDPYNPHAISAGAPITLARVIEQESPFLPGVSVRVGPVRNYPTGELTAHLIGFMGPIPDTSYLALGYKRDDRVGLFGLESSLERLLSGEKGRRTIEVDATGRAIRQLGPTQLPRPGFNVHLTIDMDLQRAAYDVLNAQMALRRSTPDERTGQPLEVEQGVIVALDPKTGEILAMVNMPTFDNNRFATEIPVEYYLQLARNDYQPLFNKAIGGQYPPGSVFKLVTAAAALQREIVSPSRRLQAPGSILISNRYAPNDPGRAQRFVCWVWNTFDPITGQRGAHGAVNMYEALAESCDIYFYKVAGGFNQDGEQVAVLGVNQLAVYANQFGFGRIQGIELPAEAPGNMPTEAWKRSNIGEPWSTGDDYNTAIGQGFVTSTPLQVAQMAAVIANGGFLYRPTIIHHFTDADGRVVVFDANNNPIYAEPTAGGIPLLYDASGNRLDPADVDVNILFDADGNYVRRPDLLNAVEVDREYIDVIAAGMRMANQEGGTGAGVSECMDQPCTFYEDGRVRLYYWLDGYGIVSAGKSGTAEYCDNIALSRGWCKGPGEIQPTHSWYVGYAPYEDPEIVVAAFIFNGGEGSTWAGPAVWNVMRAYFRVGPYADAAP